MRAQANPEITRPALEPGNVPLEARAIEDERGRRKIVEAHEYPAWQTAYHSILTGN
jgi:hypothetical protein